MNAVTIINPTNAEVYRASTDAAGLCREIVIKTALEIQNRKYVRVEGWQAIAIAHGCTASAGSVEAIEGGVRATGEIRRMSDGVLIASAEGFVGADEPTWFGGSVVSYGKTKTLPKRPDYAIRAMAQTRAISRACRSAFAHVVVLIDANLSTTPAEEVPSGGFDDEPRAEPRNVTPAKTAKEEVNAGVTAALAAIDLCTSVDQIKVWWPANQSALDMMNDAEFHKVKDRYETRWAVLAAADAAEAEEVFA